MTPEQRLSEIALQWGLGPDSLNAKLAIPALRKIFGRGKTKAEKIQNSTLIIRGIQLLFLDPDQTGANKRKCTADIIGVAREKWGAAGFPIGDHKRTAVLPLQALVLSTLPRNDLRIAQLAEGTFQAWPNILRSEDYLPTINSFVEELHKSTAKEIPLPSLPKARLNFKKGSEHRTKLEAAPTWGPPVVEAIKHSLLSTEQSHKHLDHRLNALESRKAHPITDPTTGVLWWGQSRYCFTLQQPFRKMKGNLPELLWWSAWELAQHCISLPLAPTSAYLAETLRALGIDVEQKKTIETWMKETAGHLSKAKTEHPAIKEIFTPWLELIQGDPLGLPVSWLRSKIINDGLSWSDISDSAETETGLDLNREIDCGDWAGWLLHELVMEHRFKDHV